MIRAPQGPPGPAGATGPAGPAGVAGITKIAIAQKFGVFYLDPLKDGALTVTCDGGKVVGGGFQQPDWYDVTVTDSYPASATAWRVIAMSSSDKRRPVYVYAMCMTTDPGTVIAKLPANFTPAKKHVKK